jgi:hypothetical protein
MVIETTNDEIKIVFRGKANKMHHFVYESVLVMLAPSWRWLTVLSVGFTKGEIFDFLVIMVSKAFKRGIRLLFLLHSPRMASRRQGFRNVDNLITHDCHPVEPLSFQWL